ncbi:MAG TPA: hypothetical protein VGL22_13950 [Terracidiphilus sp.]|jgi:hypothetical protein
MKILRSITRRGFQIQSAGFYTVLKPNTWFPASRLPVPFRYHAHPSAYAAQETTAPNIITIAAERRHPLQLTLILLASAAIVLAMLWWIMYP